MDKYYTRACNFYYGQISKEKVKKKKSLPLNGNNLISFDQIELITRKSKKKININKLNYKFSTKIGEAGINFSGGQLQRIAIARALYRKSDILILDESTNSLDNNSELMFFKFLKTLKKKFTIIIISHKHENLSICDRIIKIKKN